MKNLTIASIVSMVLALVAVDARAAAAGSSYKKAGSISAGKTKTVTLVDEADPEDGSSYGTGAYFLKFTASRGTAYTITAKSASEDGVGLDVSDLSTYDFDKEVNAPWFEGSTDPDGTERAILRAEEWDAEWHDAKVSYYIYLSGEIGDSVTVSLVTGVEESPTPSGTMEKPTTLSPTAAEAKLVGELTEGSYYCTAELTAGNKYKFWTSGGNEDYGLSLSIYGDSSASGELADPELRDIYDGIGEYDQGFVVIPQETGKHWIVVEGFGGDFTLHYGMVSARAPSGHPAVAVSAAEIAKGYEDENCEPGHRNNPESGFYDSVIDEQLYKVSLEAGKKYAFATDGAGAPIVMELYDSTGKVLVSSKGTTTSEYDGLIAYKCDKTGDYWVGVCEDLENDDEDDTSGMVVSFTAMKVNDGDGLHDESDPYDDDYLGANALVPGMGEFPDDEDKSHTLGIADYVDVFRLDARKGISYTVQSVLDKSATELMASFKLKATIYTVTNGKRSDAKSDITVEDLSAGYTLTAKDNVSYYIEIRVDDGEGHGQGYDYGPYHVLAKADSASGVGALIVDIGGATFAEGATWSIVSDGKTAPKYAGGASILLPAGQHEIVFADKVSNWTRPENEKVEIEVGKVTRVEVKYSDVFDVIGSDATDGDGSRTGKKVTILKPAAKEAVENRSLWNNDESDWYKVAVAADTYYRFALKETARLGDAEIVVFRENGVDIVACGTAVEFLCREAKATYWVCVGHSTAAKIDSQYEMAYSSTAVGGIVFKGDVSVKDTVALATLTVKRIGGKEGRVRVRYSTFEGTAKPGVDYEPQNGFLEWADGDAKDKTISVTIIPDLVSKWGPDRSFTVQLAPVPYSSLEEDEMTPAINTPSVASVLITESVKTPNTGTVSPVGWGIGCEAFTDAKKPTLTMPAGENMMVWFERTGGTDGKVAVTVTPTKGTAVADEHFAATPTTLVWDHGESGTKAFTLATFASNEAYMSAKSLTLKLTVDKSASPYAAKLGNAVTVTLADPKVTKTIESYAAGFSKADGIVVKAGKADTWYFNEIGDLTSITPAEGGKVELTVTLTGPGRFVCSPTFNADGNTKSTCTVTVGKESPVALTPGMETEIKRYLPAGATTVKFTLSRAKTARGEPVADGDISLSFADSADGGPFGWKPLPQPTLVMPLAGEVSIAGRCGDVPPNSVKFGWSDVNDPEIVYVFTLDADKKKLGLASALFPNEVLSSADKIIQVYCADCAAMPIAGQLASGQTYWWRVSTTFADEACSVTNTNPNVWQITPLECEGTPYPVVAGGTDAYGSEIASLEKVGSSYPVSLVQGVMANISLRGDRENGGAVEAVTDATFAVVKGSSLPKGLSLGKDGTISGAPSKTGQYTTIVQVSYKSGKATYAGGTLTFAFDVLPLGLADGTFNGVMSTGDNRILQNADGLMGKDALNRFGSITFSSASGKLSAKLSVGGTSYSYSAPCWSGVTTLENGRMGVTACITNSVKLTTTKTKEKAAQTYIITNVLTVTACCGETDDREALDTPMDITADLSFLAADKTDVYTNVLYSGTAYRDNKKLAAYVTDVSPFTGYYTISLAPEAAIDYKTGYGYLTLTVDAKGGAKLAGVLADGATKPTSSAVAYISESAKDGEPALVVPVYYSKGTAMFCGTIVLRIGEGGTPYVDSDSRVTWIDADPNSTYDGSEGFLLEIEPVGGFYNTLYNLQAYYLNLGGSSYALKVMPIDTNSDLPEELLGAHEVYAGYPGLFDEYLTLAGNNISAEKSVLAYRAATTKLIDWENSVNPANLSFSFKQATGIYSGKFDLYAGDALDDDWVETKQTKLGSFSHQGVLLMNRDVQTAALPFSDAVMPGFYLVPVKVPVGTGSKTRTFTASLPFVIAPEERNLDLSEGFQE